MNLKNWTRLSVLYTCHIGTAHSAEYDWQTDISKHLIAYIWLQLIIFHLDTFSHDAKQDNLFIYLFICQRSISQ